MTAGVTRPLAPIRCACGKVLDVSVFFDMVTARYIVTATCAPCDIEGTKAFSFMPNEAQVGAAIRAFAADQAL